MNRIILLALFTVALLISPLYGRGQDASFSKIMEVPGTNKDTLFHKGLEWLALNFQSANDVIQLKDSSRGEIIGKGSIRYKAKPFNPGTNYSGFFLFTIKLDFKDGKYRYVIDNFSHQSFLESYSGGSFRNEKPDCGYPLTKKNWKKLKDACYEDIDVITNSLTNYMASSNNDKW